MESALWSFGGFSAHQLYCRVIAEKEKVMTNPPVDSTQLTRQQLEELDVLLQRMLAMTQKACAEDASINNITSLSNPREFLNNPTVDKYFTFR
jgi:hypothetical protein